MTLSLWHYFSTTFYLDRICLGRVQVVVDNSFFIAISFRPQFLPCLSSELLREHLKTFLIRLDIQRKDLPPSIGLF